MDVPDLISLAVVREHVGKAKARRAKKALRRDAPERSNSGVSPPSPYKDSILRLESIAD